MLPEAPAPIEAEYYLPESCFLAHVLKDFKDRLPKKDADQTTLEKFMLKAGLPPKPVNSYCTNDEIKQLNDVFPVKVYLYCAVATCKLWPPNLKCKCCTANYLMGILTGHVFCPSLSQTE